MIIVTGSLHARPDGIDELLSLSLAHVRRSRQEPGCLAHAVHLDAEDPLHLVFLEHWADEASLHVHFRRDESSAFVRAVGALVASAPEMAVYDARQVVR